MKNIVKRFASDESGATAIEYGLLAAFIAVAIVATLRLIGPNLNAKFASVNAALAS